MTLHSGLTFLGFIIGYLITNTRLCQATGSLISYLEDCTANPSLISQLKANQSVIYPVLVVNETYQPVITASQTHPSKIQLAFLHANKQYLVRLQLNRQVRTTTFYSEDESSANVQTMDMQEGDNCYYQGLFTVPEHADDFITVSTCAGIRGTLRINKEAYSIAPARGPLQGGKCQGHILSRQGVMSAGECSNKHIHWQDVSKLYSTQYYRQLSKAPANKVDRNGASWVERNLESKHLKLGIIVDDELSRLFLHNYTRIREYLLDVTNVLDLFYQRVNIRISLSYENILRSHNQLQIGANVKETLYSLVRYSKSHLPTNIYHVVHLLSGKEFEDNSIGLAIPNSICTDRAIAVVSARQHLTNSHKLASVLAHMIGHNIGLDHDTPGCGCTDSSGRCIMNLSAGEQLPSLFSACSVDRLKLLTRVRVGQCLNSPSSKDLYPQKCGNGRVERGEQCDCGPPAACQQVDKCCDAITCLLKPWATCRSGACCHDCLPKMAFVGCRPARGDCDAPESCDGINGECPPDLFIQDGQPCAGSLGVCYQGECPLRSKQCQSLWGVNSTSSPDVCYSKQNLEGSVLGHCGVRGGGGYRKCLPRHTACGSLQCDGGVARPLVDGVDYRKTSTNEYLGGLGEVTCKTVSARPPSYATQVGMVQDGTKCGEGSLCQGHRCVPITSLKLHQCLTSPGTNLTCSGNGRCVADGSCSCYHGYTGAVCQTLVPTVSPSKTAAAVDLTTSGNAEKSRMTRGVLVALIVVPIILFSVAITTLLLFRSKRWCFHSQKKAGAAQLRLANQSQTRAETSANHAMPLSYYANYGNRKRRYRRRRRSSSSSGESTESCDESSLPCVIYDVPEAGPNIKSILKKVPSQRSYHSEGEGNSQSSSDGSSCSSCSINDNPTTNRLPVPDEHTDDRQHVIWQSSRPPLRPEVHDSNSDSAIDLPKSDKIHKVVGESSSDFTDASPTSKPTDSRNRTHAILESHAVKNSFTRNQPAVGAEASDCAPRPGQTVLIHVDSMKVNSTDVYEEEASAEGYSMFSARPMHGPMRTFQPTGNSRENIELSEASKLLISNNT